MFRVAPGIKGMVMLVFDLPSFPYVFKVIKDRFPQQKETTREQVMGKYLLVKRHDRVGRMADTSEYSNVAFPRNRFDDELFAELWRECASLLEEDGDMLIIRHVYIERRMIPLNIYLKDATPQQIEHAVVEYGNAIKDLVSANIFPGDMLWKNFGVTRHGKVVFYDYDEIEYLTDCQLPPGAGGTHRRRRAVQRGLVRGRPEGRVSRDLRPVPARQSAGARGVHEAPRRPARPCVLERAQAAHPVRPRARRVSVRRAQALQEPAPGRRLESAVRGGADGAEERRGGRIGDEGAVNASGHFTA